MIETIDGLKNAESTKFQFKTKFLAPAMGPLNSRHPFHADDSQDTRISQWHKAHPTKFPLQCHYSGDIIVSGMGHLWKDGRIIIEPTLMPVYWQNRVFENEQSDPNVEVSLPIREIDDPCICAIGWGFEIYGHFLIEMLPRLLTAINLCKYQGISPKILLRSDSPEWMKNIIRTYLSGGSDPIVFFDPKKERVKLNNGIYPTYPYFAHGFHPVTKDLIETIEDLPPHSELKSGNYFLSRASMPFSATRRTCTNEEELADIARNVGITVISPESMTWAEQIGIFRKAKSVVGLYGSALHTSIFSDENILVGTVGLVNPVQTHIAALRQHRMAYQIKDFNLARRYQVPVEPFKKMLEKIVNRP